MLGRGWGWRAWLLENETCGIGGERVSKWDRAMEIAPRCEHVLTSTHCQIIKLCKHFPQKGGYLPIKISVASRERSPEIGYIAVADPRHIQTARPKRRW